MHRARCGKEDKGDGGHSGSLWTLEFVQMLPTSFLGEGHLGGAWCFNALNLSSELLSHKTCSLTRRKEEWNLPTTAVRFLKLLILSKQWAAETTQVVSIRVPPHNSTPFSFRATWQGYNTHWKITLLFLGSPSLETHLSPASSGMGCIYRMVSEILGAP